jgi:hypothetical protein
MPATMSRVGLRGVVACVATALGACGPDHTCLVVGKAVVPSGDPNVACEIHIYVGDRADALFLERIRSGESFEIRVRLPIIEPALEHHAVVHCPGYQPEPSRTFKLGRGWTSCATEDLGDIQLHRLNDGKAQGERAREAPSNNAMQLTRGGWRRMGASSSATTSS